MGPHRSPRGSKRPEANPVEVASMRLLAPEVKALVAEANCFTKGKETIQETIHLGTIFTKLFGYRKYGGHEKTIPGLLKLSKKEYIGIGLQVRYEHVRKFIQVANDPKMTNPNHWE